MLVEVSFNDIFFRHHPSKSRATLTLNFEMAFICAVDETSRARARLSAGSERLFFIMFRAVKCECLWIFFYCLARIKSLDLKRYLMVLWELFMMNGLSAGDFVILEPS